MEQLDENRMKALIEEAIKISEADDVLVRVTRGDEGATRFSGGEISQNIVRRNAELGVEVAFDHKVGGASTNRLDRESIAACVRRAEAMARVSPPDPEYMPPVEPSSAPVVKAFYPDTAAFSPTDRACAIGKAVGVAAREKMSGAGVLTTRASAEAIGNSAGQLVYHESTTAVTSFSAALADSTGWAEGRAHNINALDMERIAARAVEKARSGRAPRDVEPGRYDVILEPAAVGEFLLFFYFYQMDAKATDEGRTYLTGKKGQHLAAPAVTLFSDPTARDCDTRPFTGEAMPLRRIDWLRDGELENLQYSRFWAKKQGVEPTGSPTNLILKGGRATRDEMIASTERGLLVTRFWYIRAVEPMQDIFTGMTRDGTFLIENGKIAGPVRNLRFNESPVRFLSNIELLGEQQVTGEGMWMLMPYVKAKEFNFTSTTKF